MKNVDFVSVDHTWKIVFKENPFYPYLLCIGANINILGVEYVVI
jgi:hypothetical protein